MIVLVANDYARKEGAFFMTNQSSLDLTNSTPAVSLRTLGLICLAVGVFGCALGILEFLAPVLANYPSSLGTPTPEFNHAAPEWQRVLVGFGHLLKSVAFLSVLYGVFFAGTRKGRLLWLAMAAATAGALWYGGYWVWMTITGQFSFAFVPGGLWYQWVAPVALGIGVLRARKLTKRLAILFIVTGLINSVIFVFGAAGGQVVQGTLWFLLGGSIYSAERNS